MNNVDPLAWIATTLERVAAGWGTPVLPTHPPIEIAYMTGRTAISTLLPWHHQAG